MLFIVCVLVDFHFDLLPLLRAACSHALYFSNSFLVFLHKKKGLVPFSIKRNLTFYKERQRSSVFYAATLFYYELNFLIIMRLSSNFKAKLNQSIKTFLIFSEPIQIRLQLSKCIVIT